MLLLAAELPFRRIIGVEFSSDLHSLARNSVKAYRSRKQTCFQIEPVYMDATSLAGHRVRVGLPNQGVMPHGTEFSRRRNWYFCHLTAIQSSSFHGVLTTPYFLKVPVPSDH
jgi:hypothetical protein